MPCLEPECIEKMAENKKPKHNVDDYCNICYCTAVGQDPSVILGCGHVYHLDCIKDLVKKGYNGPRIVFNHIDCPECKVRMDAKQCPQLDQEIKKVQKFEKIVIDKAMERAKFEDLHKDDRYI